MRVLFDQGTPAPLRKHLHPHPVDTASELGCSTFLNGDLLNQAESQGYEAFITTDQNLRYQQDLSMRKIRMLVLKTTSWPKIRAKASQVKDRLEAMNEGDYQEVDF